MVKIIADSTCDLSDELIHKYNIGIVPLTITIEGKDYRDRVDISPNEFYSIMEKLEENPKTSMPDPVKYMEAFKSAYEEGKNKIICICMSSGTSGSYQSAIIAKDQLIEEKILNKDDIHIVDSKCMSHGSGYLILKTALLLEKGLKFNELIKFNELYKKNIKHYLAVDDLSHLLKSGRLSNASVLIGKLLRLKPIMSMKNGRGSIEAKERGKKRVLKYYVKEYIRRVEPTMNSFIIIGYTSDIMIAKNLKKLFLEKTNFDGDVYIMQMGVSVGVHVGLGAVSMYFVEKDHLKTSLVQSELNKIFEAKDNFLKKIQKYKK